jgi:ADP-heptose:LPS heptosyltransferase
MRRSQKPEVGIAFLPAPGFWFLASGFWLLAPGSWLLASGSWLLAPGFFMKIVIPIVAGIGNALLAVPMVRQIKRFKPDAQIFIAARIDAMAEPFRRLPEVAEVFVSGKGAKGLLRGISWTRAKKADVYLIPFPSNRWQYSMLALVSGAKRKVLHSYPVGTFSALGFLKFDRLPAVRGLHDVEQNLRLLTKLGIEPDLSELPIFPIPDTDRAAADELLRFINYRVDDFVAIHAGSAKTVLAKAKRWPPKKYADLALGLMNMGLRPLLLEGPDELGVTQEILSHIPESERPRVLLLRFHLGIAAAVLERSKLYVGTDSGLAHLAAAVGKRAVTIFAPADPDRVCPAGNRDLVVQPHKSCCPCFQYPWNSTHPKMLCREPMCINEVLVDDVLAAVKRAIGPESCHPERTEGPGPSLPQWKAQPDSCITRDTGTQRSE